MVAVRPTTTQVTFVQAAQERVDLDINFALLQPAAPQHHQGLREKMVAPLVWATEALAAVQVMLPT